MDPIVVTSYTEPDLDGFSCAVAYAEFLRKTGVPAVVRFFGEPHVEAKYLVEKFGLNITEDKSADLARVALVDASELRDLDKFIKPENVVEIIDHRKVNDASLFKNAKIQIEFVGSAATLIAEKFHAKGIEISTVAATLLYGAIVSNTLNFRAKVTTDRDRQMAAWLDEKLKFDQAFIDEMFLAKSDVAGEKLKERIIADFAWFSFGGRKIGFAQLEIVDAHGVALNREEEILDILVDIKESEHLDDIFISLIDLGGFCNLFITASPALRSTLAEVLHIEFDGALAIQSGFIMRKELVPLLRERLG